MEKRVFILRGLPGSGKSTIAKLLAAATAGIICNADAYLYDDKGVYRWTEKGVARAHILCMKDFRKALDDGAPSIILDNTNLVRKVFAWYRREARKRGYKIFELVVGRPNYEPDVEACAGRNTHEADIEVLKKMSSLFRL